jgi:acetoin utilization deacetylase AcuC-like enzyme
VRFWSHDRLPFPLPDGHRFPLAKYRLLREAVEREGLGEVRHAGPVPWSQLEAVHAPAYLRSLRDGTLDRRAERALGLPWSPELVERARRSVQATIEAAGDALGDGVGMNLGGGTHHAGYDQARGYCVFNDVPVAVAALRGPGRLGRVLVVDCDVHQGDGTADILATDPNAFTLSLHGARNYPFARIPSDLDVDVASGTGDARYLRALH